MTDLEQRIRRDLLTAVRDEPAPVLPTGPDYRCAARRRWPALLPSVAAAAAVLLVVGAAVVLLNRGPGGVPSPAGGVGVWPARGSLAGDVSLTSAATRTWEAALLPRTELPHHDVRVLYAEHTIAGDVVVLTGLDALGHRRIAEFDTDPTSKTVFRHRLHLVADLLAPTGDAAGLVAIDAPRPTPRKSDDDLLVVLAAPGTQKLEWHDEVTHWQKLPAVNGAGSLVHVQHTLSTSVRAGNDGDGVSTIGRFFPVGTVGFEIEHDRDPGAQPPAGPDGGATAKCDGGTCSVSTGGPMTVQANPEGNWRNLLDSSPMSTHEWWEFGGEVGLYTETFLPNDADWSGASWSGVLPDGTGIFLEFFKPGKDPTHLVAYVDRPEWNGGSVVDVVPPNGQLPALAVDVTTARNRTLDIVVADGYTPQWRANDGAWQPMTVHDNVATAVVPGATHLTWRVLDHDGAVAADGTPNVVIAR